MPTLGTVSLRDFDRGLIETFGSVLIPFAVDGGVRQVYAKQVDGVTTNVPQFNGMVPVFFAYPEDVFQNHRIPCFVFKRTSLASAFDRAPWYGYERVPSATANPLSVQVGNTTLNGYDSYVSKWNAVPFNIGYDVQIMARTQGDGLKMLMSALKVFRAPFFTTRVTDSIGDVRGYDTGEVTMSESSELSDIVNRMISWTVTFEVRGELDLESEHESNVGDEENGIITSYVRVMTEIYRLTEGVM